MDPEMFDLLSERLRILEEIALGEMEIASGNHAGWDALDNSAAADKVSAHAELVVECAKTFPDIDRQVISDLPLRELLAYPRRIFYHRVGDTLWVVAVLRVEQLVRREIQTERCAGGRCRQGPS